MKVLLLNGSPHEKGSTFTGLSEVATALNTHGIETEIFWLGAKAIKGCIGCGYCKKGSEHCVFGDDVVNEVIDKLEDFDGYIAGSPVHYAAASGTITSFMDRLFYAAGSKMAYKPGACVVSCRRGGASAAFDQLNKYFTINNMLVVGSSYWNQIHGTNGEEVLQDLEGMQTMRNLGNHMAWILKCIDNGRAAGIPAPERETQYRTNFIR